MEDQTQVLISKDQPQQQPQQQVVVTRTATAENTSTTKKKKKTTTTTRHGASHPSDIRNSNSGDTGKSTNSSSSSSSGNSNDRSDEKPVAVTKRQEHPPVTPPPSSSSSSRRHHYHHHHYPPRYSNNHTTNSPLILTTDNRSHNNGTTTSSSSSSNNDPSYPVPPPQQDAQDPLASQIEMDDNQQHHKATFLTSVDLDTIEKLDADYERALLQREIGWNARYISVRQNAGLSLWFFFVFLMCGTLFFDVNTDWTLGESLLFSVYTITTVGYGNHVIPNKPSVLIFICFYIFIGIALLTILAAQLYQWITLEITWVQYKSDSRNFLKRHRQSIQNAQYLEATMMGSLPIRVRWNMEGAFEDDNDENDGERELHCTKECTCQDKLLELGLKLVSGIQAYIKDNPVGQLLVVLVPFLVLILLGAAVVGTVQGWDVHESIYFAVVSMTTVGFGDYYPSELASTWFCIFWLPFSVGFLSLYLGSIAQLYLHISKQNVKRVKSNLRARVYKMKRQEERERAEVIARVTSGGFDLGAVSAAGDGGGGGKGKGGATKGGDGEEEIVHGKDIPDHVNRSKKSPLGQDGFVMLPESPSVDQYYGHDSGSSSRKRRDNILYNSRPFVTEDEEMSGETMKSMKHVIVAVKENIAMPRRIQEYTETMDANHHHGGAVPQSNPHLSLKSTRHYKTAQGIEKKPSFALRVLVQERFSKIIAHEIAGYQSQVEIKNNTLLVTIDSLKQTADKWVIPRRARKAFRAVAFEVLYFVGERALIVNGADAVLELRPNEVQSLFAPLLAAFGDADTMEAWLVRTQIMADNELHEPCLEGKQLVFDRIMKSREAKLADNLTASPSMKRNLIGNAVSNQM